jgi:hypothetical protein
VEAWKRGGVERGRGEKERMEGEESVESVEVWRRGAARALDPDEHKGREVSWLHTSARWFRIRTLRSLLRGFRLSVRNARKRPPRAEELTNAIKPPRGKAARTLHMPQIAHTWLHNTIFVHGVIIAPLAKGHLTRVQRHETQTVRTTGSSCYPTEMERYCGMIQSTSTGEFILCYRETW